MPKLTLLDRIRSSNSMHRIKIRWDHARSGMYILYLDYCHDNRRERKYIGVKLSLRPRDQAADENAVRYAMMRRDDEERSLRMGSEFTQYSKGLALSEYAARIIREKKAKNAEGYQIALDHFLRIFRDMPLPAVTKEMALQYRGAFKSLSPNSRNHYVAAMRHIYDCAIRDGLVSSNPFEGLRKERVVSDREYLTKDELVKLIDAPCGHPGVRNAFLFSCFTGIRWGDLVRLRAEDVRDGYLYFRQSKTGQQQCLMVPEVAVDLINSSGRLIDLPSYDVMRKHLRRWVEAAGIGKKITFHCARHTFATLQIDLGTDLYVVSKLLGHSDVRITQVYARLMDRRRDEAMGRLDELLHKKQ